MSRGWKEMAAEVGMFLASVALLGCVALAVFDVALVDYGDDSSACPPTAAGAPDGAADGAATWSVVPPGVTCTWGSGADEVSSYEPMRVPLALAGAAVSVVVLVLLRRISLRLQAPAYRERDPLYAEDILDDLDRRRRRRGAPA